MVSVEPTDARQIRGELIASSCRITKNKEGWIVPSQSGRGTYLVAIRDNEPICNCPDCELNHKKCKHIFAVEMLIRREIDSEGNATITKAVKVSYAQNWHAYDKSQMEQKSAFMELLCDLCSEVPNQTYTFGRPTYPMSDMVFTSALKVFTTFSLRRFTSDMKEAKEKGYIDKAPYYSTVARYMENEGMTPVLMELIQKSSLPLKSVESDFAVDSSGFGASRFDRWYSFKYGKNIKKQAWLKTHIACGVKTNIITSVKITDGFGNDCPQFQELVSKTAENFKIGEVSADKGYLSQDNFRLVSELGGSAFIPFRRNCVARARNSRLWKKMFHYFMYNHEEFLAHYHKRSNVESTFHMIKSKFGDSLRSKSKTAQINEVLLKVLCHNICVVIQEVNELGIEANFD